MTAGMFTAFSTVIERQNRLPSISTSEAPLFFKEALKRFAALESGRQVA